MLSSTQSPRIPDSWRTALKCTQVGAALAAFSLAGCTQKSIEEEIAARPEVSATSLKRELHTLVGEEISVKASLQFVQNRSAVRYDGQDLYLDVAQSYKCLVQNGEAEIDLWVLGVYRVPSGQYSLDQIGALSDSFKLSPYTNVVCGKVEKYADGGGFYLRYKYSLYTEPAPQIERP